MSIKSIFATVAIIATFLIPQSQAQVAIKAGVNFASISESASLETYESLKNNSVTGFQAGISFDLGLSEMFTIQPELLYIQKGGKSTYSINAENKFVSRLYYNYVEVPVLAKLKFYKEDGGGFYLLGGPFIGLAISGKSKRTTTLLGESTTVEEDFNFDNDDEAERQKRTDWGVSFGGGVKFGHMFIDARYNLGINNLLDTDANNQNDNAPYRRTRGIGLTLGYEF
ncbi:MAG: porin family protein [Saprospiraceae bacterium]|nr:porin family protein [Saprospiraceae bacterium]